MNADPQADRRAGVDLGPRQAKAPAQSGGYFSRLGAHPHVDHHAGVLMFQIVAMEHVNLVATKIM